MPHVLQGISGDRYEVVLALAKERTDSSTRLKGFHIKNVRGWSQCTLQFYYIMKLAIVALLAEFFF